jgi:hypothetical protein
MAMPIHPELLTDLFNKIDHERLFALQKKSEPFRRLPARPG